MNLTKNFTLSELTISQEAARSGIKNVPTQSSLANLKALCENILQPLRDRVRRPIVVSSGFRSVTINRRIGGANGSQHTKGQAVDFTIPGMSVAETVLLIRRMELPFDQLIDEEAWVHVSYGPRHRRQVLKAKFKNGKAEYSSIK
jgi:uncharacterized protein YcbK (DUF882 family)